MAEIVYILIIFSIYFRSIYGLIPAVSNAPKTLAMPKCPKNTPEWIESTVELCAVVGDGNAKWVGLAEEEGVHGVDPSQSR